MVVAGSRAVLLAARRTVERVADFVPLRGGMGFYCVTLTFVPLLGSFITEPAAMTLAALMMRDRVFGARISTRLQYATLGVLFVNVSIGGTLTPFAAPPVLMVASQWNWDFLYMASHFGWKAALAVGVNALVATFVFGKELARLDKANGASKTAMPRLVVGVHLAFLVGIVLSAHHPPVFLGLFLFFMGFAVAYPKYQDRLILREGLLVAFFLAGLVVLGGQQQWWIEPLLRGLSVDTVYFGATLLTAITDNAALTYLGSQVDGLSEEFKRALVAGAVTGGGLTVIANAPNPAGFAILRGKFEDHAIHPLGLLVAAIPPTLTAVLAFRLL
jgi:predicted cation transporter